MLQRGNGIHAVGHVTALGDIRPGIKMEYNEEEEKKKILMILRLYFNFSLLHEE